MMSPEEIDDWANAYIKAECDPDLLKVKDHPFWWAVDRFWDVARAKFSSDPDLAEPDDCWKAILRVLELDPPPHVLEVLSASALEDLVGYCGAQFIDRIEAESKRNPSFRRLLRGVWKSGASDDLWARVVACREEASL